MNRQVKLLIDDYLETVGYYVDQMRKLCGQKDLLAARRSGQLNARGFLNGDVQYIFHGVGCRIVSTSVEIDFDFGEAGNVDGFDACRLWDFVQNSKDKYPYIKNIEMLEKEIKILAATGVIKKTEQFPSPHLYVFCDESKASINSST